MRVRECWATLEKIVVQGDQNLIKDTYTAVYLGLSDSRAPGEEFWLKS